MIKPEGSTSAVDHRNGQAVAFVTDYLACLRERTRAERGGIVFGLDWVVYNLCLALDWLPVRLPFLRDPSLKAAKTKTETEFGVDMAFLDDGETHLRILVLKDESLSNRNWTEHNFDSDLRRAAYPDLSGRETKNVTRVTVTLVYNKDEDAAGITLFDRLTSALGSRVGDTSALSFDRWNLSKLSELVVEHLLSARLMPQHLSGLFSYICSQFADFDYGTDAWDRQLVPNWRRFLDEIEKEDLGAHLVRLVPVALVILDKYRGERPYAIIGWIDLAEWAILKLWRKLPDLDERGKGAVITAWAQLYLTKLESHLIESAPSLTTEHGVHTRHCGFVLDALNDACATLWHLERVGLHAMAMLELVGESDAEHSKLSAASVARAAEWIGRCIVANPSALRPLIDLHHVPLYLMWWVLWQSRRTDDIERMLTELEARLLMRRLGRGEIPFVDGGNRLDAVAEAVATGETPPELIVTSSYLLTMLMELCFSLGDRERDDLLSLYSRRVIAGLTDDGERIPGVEAIQVLDWIPPEDWAIRVLTGPADREGIGVTAPFFSQDCGQGKVADLLVGHIAEVRSKFPWSLKADVPVSLIVLACIKHRSPLPTWFWRSCLFPEAKKD